MKLGSSLRRRWSRGRTGRSEGRAASVRNRIARPARVAGMGGALIVVAFLVGYMVATRALFPAPPPPPDLIEIPSLWGMRLDEAKSAIAAAGLNRGEVDSVRHPTAPDGTVLGQSPLPGQLGMPEGVVVVTVSSGSERRPIPHAVGLQAERALLLLESTGFTVAATDSVEGDAPRGEVIELDPPAGTEATLLSEVRLVVSMGPPMVEMPILLGMQQDEAVATLDSLGLEVTDIQTRFRFGLDQGTVIEQLPPAGDMIVVGSEVRLVVGRRGPRGRNNRGRNP